MIEQIGKYRILERIGRGGMGSVFKAHDPVLDRLVALKVISAETEFTDELRARFLREAQACAKLSHPNIVTIHDLGEVDGNVFIVMELLEGEELRQVIARRTIVHLEDKLALMTQICDGLDYAHEKGIVHRDVKPGNIFVLRNGQVKILDFGIAHIEAAQTGLTRTGLIVGTLQYMPPERVRGHGDHRSDIFSVGAVFYELLSSRPPFMGNNPMEILEKLRIESPPRLDEVDSTLPRELGTIVERALQKDPAHRYARLGQMRAELLVVRRKLAEEAERLRGQVPGQLQQLQELREALAARVGDASGDETVLVIDERASLATLEAVGRDAAARIERLRALLHRAELLQPTLDGGLQALHQGDCDRAVAELERVVREMPDHVHAVESLKEAQRQAGERRRRHEQLAALMREARAAHDAGAYARCSEILAGLAELAPPPDMQADARRLRADAEAALEALRRARDVARATLQRAEDAQRIAEAADAPRQALSLWDAAERKLAEGRAALGAERYAHGEAELEHAQQLFEQAEASARAASAAAAARRANELAAEAARAAAAERLQASERGARAEATRAADHQTQLNVAIRDVGAVMAAETSDILVADPEATMIETPTTAEVAVPVAARTPVVAAASEVAAPLVESAMAGAAQTIAMPAAAKTIASYRRLPPSALTLRASYRRLRPNVRALRYLALVAVAGIALALVVWRVETVRASKHTKETLDHLRRTVTAAREQALKAEAGRLALDVLAAGQAKASEADRFTASQNMTAAGQAYEEAAERYREAERLAQTKQQQRNEADTTRARMVTAKQRAQPGAEDFAGALVHERQATSQYERLAFMEAATSFQAAAELFSKALPKPQPVVQDPRADIRTVLNDYVRAVETKNLDLLRRVRTCFTDDDLQHVRAANDIIRSHKVELRVYELTVAGEEAQALGRREDFVLLTNGQQLRTETRFTYTFKHGPRGWALCELRESDPRPARPQAPGDPTPRHAESAPRSAKP